MICKKFYQASIFHPEKIIQTVQPSKYLFTFIFTLIGEVLPSLNISSRKDRTNRTAFKIFIYRRECNAMRSLLQINILKAELFV